MNVRTRTASVSATPLEESALMNKEELIRIILNKQKRIDQLESIHQRKQNLKHFRG